MLVQKSSRGELADKGKVKKKRSKKEVRIYPVVMLHSLYHFVAVKVSFSIQQEKTGATTAALAGAGAAPPCAAPVPAAAAATPTAAAGASKKRKVGHGRQCDSMHWGCRGDLCYMSFS